MNIEHQVEEILRSEFGACYGIPGATRRISALIASLTAQPVTVRSEPKPEPVKAKPKGSPF